MIYSRAKERMNRSANSNEGRGWAGVGRGVGEKLGGGGVQYPDDTVQSEGEKVCNCTEGGKGGTSDVMVPCSVKVSRKSATAPEVTGGGVGGGGGGA